MMATESPDLGCAQEGLKERLQRVAARGLRLATLRARNTGPVVSFTFDDVPKTSFTHGAGILDEFGAHGTFYISGGLCGTSTAERNAICNAARCGTALEHCTIYVEIMPCMDCARAIVQAGIREVVVSATRMAQYSSISTVLPVAGMP